MTQHFIVLARLAAKLHQLQQHREVFLYFMVWGSQVYLGGLGYCRALFFL